MTIYITRQRTVGFTFIFILLTLLSNCTSVPNTNITIELKGVTSYYGITKSKPGELIDAIPIGVADPGPILLRFLESDGFKSEIGVEKTKLIQELVLNKLNKYKKKLNKIEMYRIHFWTLDVNLLPISVSALVLLPVLNSNTEVPLIQINHSTSLWPNAGPTNLNFSENTWAYLLAASGYAVLLPDYPGYGDSASFHPYCLSDSLGYSGKDSISAAIELISKKTPIGINFNGKVTIAGYSEGGYASLATMIEIEKSKIDRAEIYLLIPMAAPINISEVMRKSIIEDKNYPNPFYLPFLILGWRQVDQLLLAPEKMFKPWVFEKILPLFSGYHESNLIDKEIKSTLGDSPLIEMFSDEAKNWIKNPQSSIEGEKLLKIMKDNDLVLSGLTGKTKILIIHSPDDRSVPIKNSTMLYDSLSASGSNVELLQLLTPGHNDAFFEAWIYAFSSVIEENK